MKKILIRSKNRKSSIKKLKRPDNNIIRRRKFTRRNRKLIYEALRTGLPISKAIELTDLDRSTYYRWMQKGKDHRYPVHMRFRNVVLRIQAKLQIEKLNVIRKVAQGNFEIIKTKVKTRQNGDVVIVRTVKNKAPCWQAAAWFLERRFPDEYGKRRKFITVERLEETNPEEKALEIKQAFDAIFQSVPTKP